MQTSIIAPSSLLPAGVVPSAPGCAGAFYSGLTPGKRYTWIKGANDQALVNGSSEVKSSSSCVAAGASVISIGNYAKLEDVTGQLVPLKLLAVPADVLGADGKVLFTALVEIDA